MTGIKYIKKLHIISAVLVFGIMFGGAHLVQVLAKGRPPSEESFKACTALVEAMQSDVGKESSSGKNYILEHAAKKVLTKNHAADLCTTWAGENVEAFETAFTGR